MKSKLIALFVSVSSFGAIPMLAQAQGMCSQVDTNNTIQGIICKAGEILAVLLPFLVALGVIIFVWGVISYVIASDEEAKTRGRDRMIYGIIGLAVIIALWGLVKILTNTFELNSGTEFSLPVLPS